jgi:hypothetical protein
MRRSKYSDPDMHLPAGKTCADCGHFERCSEIFDHIAPDEVCAWAPSRFAQRAIAIAAAPGWTAEEEEQFRVLERQQAAGEVPC